MATTIDNTNNSWRRGSAWYWIIGAIVAFALIAFLSMGRDGKSRVDGYTEPATNTNSTTAPNTDTNP